MGKPEIYIYLYIFIYLTFRSWNLEFSNTIGALKFINGKYFFSYALKKKGAGRLISEVSQDPLMFLFSVTFPDALQYVKQPR